MSEVPPNGEDPFVDVDQGWTIERATWWLQDLRSRPDRLLGGIAALIALVGVAWYLSSSVVPEPRPEDGLPMATPLPIASPPGAPPGQVVAHAAGAVVRPGVYAMPAGSRVDDLIAVAQGLRPDADLREVNLAATIEDGARVYIPVVGEDAPSVRVDGAGPESSASAGPGNGDPLDLNRASATDLEALPGVGPATAAAIVGHREREGAFTVLEDLLAVTGIGPAKLEQIRPHAVVR